MLDPEVAKAFANARRATEEPLAVAEENATLRSAVQGAYAILFALVERAGGEVTITAEEYQNVPAWRVVKVDDSDPEGAVRVYLDKR